MQNWFREWLRLWKRPIPKSAMPFVAFFLLRLNLPIIHSDKSFYQVDFLSSLWLTWLITKLFPHSCTTLKSHFSCAEWPFLSRYTYLQPPHKAPLLYGSRLLIRAFNWPIHLAICNCKICLKLAEQCWRRAQHLDWIISRHNRWLRPQSLSWNLSFFVIFIHRVHGSRKALPRPLSTLFQKLIWIIPSLGSFQTIPDSIWGEKKVEAVEQI